MSTTNPVPISRSLAVAIFREVGIPSADNWKRGKMQEKLNQINKLVPSGTTIENEGLNVALQMLVTARDLDNEIELLSDKQWEERYNTPAEPQEPEKEEKPEEAAAEEKKPEEPPRPATSPETGVDLPGLCDERLKLANTESWAAAEALVRTSAIKAKRPDGSGGITDETWAIFSQAYDGKNTTRKGFMSAARQAIRGFLLLPSERDKPGKAYVAGKFFREHPDKDSKTCGEWLDGASSENHAIAKKAKQAIASYLHHNAATDESS